jgi:predicted nicotinamide N-methyase
MSELHIQEVIRSGTEIGSPPACPEMRMHLAHALTPLWQAGQRIHRKLNLDAPYWGFAWAGAQALARHILDSPWLVRGRRVLDFSAGSGIAGIAAALSGAARVDASDPDPVAAQAIALNAESNNVAITFRNDDVMNAPVGAWDVILAGDVLYEPATAERFLPWMRQCAVDGAMIMLSDPGGNFHGDLRFARMARYLVPVAGGGEASTMPTMVYRMAGFRVDREAE